MAASTSANISLSIKFAESKKVQIKSEWVEPLDANEEMDSFDELFPDPVFKYPFELDTFQKQAIQCLERHDNVFVAAHTSAGKTVVAEYAIAMALLRNKTKVIYTSPIKALSNQKYRDFRTTFGFSSVGIITGDVQIQPEADCLVMTTEILLNMLYNSNEILSELEWVIFDEVHYCNDPDRGHVWEKVFILLPEHISLVLLSATVANIPDFADWLGRTRNRKTYVIYTTKRPVPLEHYLFIGKSSKGKEEKFLFVDQSSNLLEQGYRDALIAMQEKESLFAKKYGPKAFAPASERNFFIGLIRHLEADQKLPVIIFTLSRKRCDSNALSISSSVNLCTGEESALIHRFITKRVKNLSENDRKIPQVIQVTEMLKRGFGVHHSGILPLLKEITEILFQMGFIKVLYATETFAMGVNMPARTVAFDSVDKHDGLTKRPLLASEYIQMAGRAGRRGKDATGTVLVLCKQSLPELSVLHKMALGSPAPLQSQFRLTYSLILNLVRTTDTSTNSNALTSLMGRSFIEHDKAKAKSRRQGQLEKLQEQNKQISFPVCANCKEDLEIFCYSYLKYVQLLDPVMQDMVKACSDKKVFTAGRLMIYESPSNPFALAILLSFKRGIEMSFSVLSVDAREIMLKGPVLGDLSTLEIVTIRPEQLHSVLCPLKLIKVDSAKIQNEKNLPIEDRKVTSDVIFSLFSFLAERSHELGPISPNSLFQLPSVDHKKELKLVSLEFSMAMDKMKIARDRMLSHICLDCPNFNEHYAIASQKVNLQQYIDQLTFELSPDSMRHLPEYNQRMKVLESLGYINQHGKLAIQGQVACIFSDHELVLTEIIFHNLLEALKIEEVSAILSGFVFQVKSGSGVNEVAAANAPTPESKRVTRAIIEIATKIGHLQLQCGLNEPVGDFVDSINFGMMNIAYEWAKGTPLKDILEIVTEEVQEGLIVRTLQRLDEVLADIKEASELMGNSASLGDGTSLAEKMDQTSRAIRRDIVFAPSLYTQADSDLD